MIRNQRLEIHVVAILAGFNAHLFESERGEETDHRLFVWLHLYEDPFDNWLDRSPFENRTEEEFADFVAGSMRGNLERR